MGDPQSTREAEAFLARHPELSGFDLLITDTNGILRGKRINRDALLKIYADGLCMPGSIFGMDITGITVEATGLGFEQGDADRICRPVPGSLRVVPWREPAAGQLLLSMYEEDGRPFFADPRQVLAGVLERFRDLDLTPVVAVELELYLIDRQRGSDGGPLPPISPVTGLRETATQVYGVTELDDYSALFDDLARMAAEQAIPADTAIAEYAPGQYEVNLRHRPDALAACDDAVMLKRLIRSVAQRHGMEATFMAKPYPEISGSGMHIHVSLVDERGVNVFQTPGSPNLDHALGGLLATMAEATALFAPNANSYRRLQPENYVPTAANWGRNNRTTALRIPAGVPEATRIEHRVAGADANPYLVMAAVLAGIHHGISARLEPAPAVEGNAYVKMPPSLPPTWLQALAAWEHSEVLADYLGRDFQRLYLVAKQAERARFQNQITPLEYAWYLRTV